MKTRSGLFVAVVLGAMLAGCAATGTRVTSSSEGYKDMAKSQGWWCSTFSSTCTCYMDGVQTTCSLVQACVSSGNCKAG
ncbi:MAG TPA: hypothetical protein VGI14_15720 [Casimicrobiaceae bacterium]|jgi:hypothetical protein